MSEKPLGTNAVKTIKELIDGRSCIIRVKGTLEKLRKKFLFAFPLLLLISCTLSYDKYHDEPKPKSSQDNNQGVRTEDKHDESIFFQSYITEDLKDALSIYESYDFAYEPDVNHNFGDNTTWRIGRWDYINDTLRFNYKDGGKAFGLISPYNLIYFEKDTILEFLPSSEVRIKIVINPNFEED